MLPALAPICARKGKKDRIPYDPGYPAIHIDPCSREEGGKKGVVRSRNEAFLIVKGKRKGDREEE